MVRRIVQNYCLNVHRAALLNRMPNSTSVSENSFEVANVHLALTITTSNVAEDIYRSLWETVKQVE